MKSNRIIKVNELKRISSGGDLLLDAASFEVHEGDQIALTGGSGAGKTVLLRAIALLEPNQGGEITWNGQKLNSHLIPKYRQDIHYLHQSPVLVEGTVRENLLLPYQFKHDMAISEKDINDRLEDLIHLANKEKEFLDRNTDVLSGGEKQIVALLRSFLVDPSLLLLDEPTSALDENSKMNIETLIHEWISQTGKAFIWITHDENQQQRVSTRQLRMEKGRLADS